LIASQRIHTRGEMADLIRNFPWDKTPLGSIEHWPELLVSMVNTVLDTRHPMLLWWGEHLIQFYNDAFRPSLGPDKHPKGLGQPGRECWPEVWPVVGAEIEAVMSKGEASWHENALIPIFRNGKLENVYWTYSYSPVRQADGSIIAILITVTETTDRINAENRLRVSEERLRVAQSAAHLATWDWDLQTGEVTWDPGSAWVYGRPPEHVARIEACAEAILEADRESTMAALQHAIELRKEYNHEFRVRWPDDSVHWLAGRGQAVCDRNGNPIRVLGVNWDQTARKKAELALQAERQRLDELFRQAPAFVAVLRGPDHIFELANPLYQELVGPRSLVGKSVKQAIPEAEQQGFIGILDRVFRSGEPFVAHDLPVLIARGRGDVQEQVFLDFVYQPIREADGEVTGIIVFGVDVTIRGKAERALRETEKLAAVGRLASSIAHEINNPLEAVTNLIYLSASLADTPTLKSYLDLAQQELARVANIATQTLRFHRQSTEARRTSVSEILDSVLMLFRQRFTNADLTVERQYRTEQTIIGYESDLRQVFTNLISNAIDATKARGRMVLRVRESTNWKTGGKGVRVSIGDNGHGMSEETRRHIFEPFFTTKGITGTGLGLWISQEILDNHGASSQVRSSTDPDRHGTVFSVWLPFTR
jgi:signal transduction histidine kinase